MLRQVERRVNELIRLDNHIEEHREATMDEAKAMGAIALFGEKYGDKVRVVKFGDSVELCGGVHAHSTGNIGSFRIISEGAVAAGVRRIEAVTGLAAETSVEKLEDTVAELKSIVGGSGDLTAAINKLIAQNAAYKKTIEEAEKQKAKALKKELAASAETVNGHKLIVLTESLDPALVRNIALEIGKEEGSVAFVAAFEFNERPQLLLLYSQDLVSAGKNASTDIKAAAKEILGGGGGNAQMASAGGKNVSGLAAALKALKEIASK